MSLAVRLRECLAVRAARETVEVLSIGLGYTAVCTSGGGIGLAYTPFESKAGCSALDRDEEYEGEQAGLLLAQLDSSIPLRRAMGLATANALAHADALSLPDDRGNELLAESLGIAAGTRVALVGCIRPLVEKLRGWGAEVEVVDTGKSIGDPARFRRSLKEWAEVLLMTSTTIINGSFDELIQDAGPGVRAALIGPGTPLVAAPFAGLPVRVLAGTVPLDREATLRAVRHGHGTPVLLRHGRKVCLDLTSAAGPVQSFPGTA
jgi:uncharacterized protein